MSGRERSALGPITNANYNEEIGQVVILAGLLAECRVDDLLDIVEKSEALGPILQPTMYRDGGSGRLIRQKRLLTACAEVVRVWRELEAENVERSAAAAQAMAATAAELVERGRRQVRDQFGPHTPVRAPDGGCRRCPLGVDDPIHMGEAGR